MDESERRRLMHERQRLVTQEAQRREQQRAEIKKEERSFKEQQELLKQEAKNEELALKQQGELEKLHTQHALQPEALNNAFNDQKRRDYLRHLLAEFAKNSELQREKELISHEREWNLIEAAFMAKLQSKTGEEVADEELRDLVKEVLKSKS